MIRVRNLEELEQAYRSNAIDRFLISPDAEKTIKDSLEFNINLLVDAYGTEGKGGYLCVIEKRIDMPEGAKEYRAELTKYNLCADDWEFDDILVQTDSEEVHLQFFVMTEYNLLILYLQKGSEAE